jgi:hypothetical protein
MKSNAKKRSLYTSIAAVIIIVGSIVAIQYAKGNFRITEKGFVQGTGLLSANSFPTAAEVIIDGKLVTATDDTVYLEPGEYEIEIVKNGYNSWKKRIKIEKELVVQTNATLFPKAPSLTTLTFNGALNLSPSPDGQKIIFYSQSNNSERKNGLYLLELSNSAFTFNQEPRQISDDSINIKLETADFIWAPDSSEVILLTENREVLLNINKLNTLDSLTDISFRKKQMLSEWEQEMYVRERENYSKFPPEVIKIATQSAKNVYISPDKKRILFTATAEVTIPKELIPQLPASSTQKEERDLSIGGIYVYDASEDRNFRVGTQASSSAQLADKMLLAKDILDKNSSLVDASPSAFQNLQATQSAQTANNFNIYHSSVFADTLQWFPDSKHLIFVEDNSVKIMEYDTTNLTTLYSGPFADNFVYPWPNGDRLVILTSFSPDAPLNFYALELEK